MIIVVNYPGRWRLATGGHLTSGRTSAQDCWTGVTKILKNIPKKHYGGSKMINQTIINCDIEGYRLPIVDLWQCCVCCTRSGVTRSTHVMAIYLCLMCQSGLHAVLWSHIGILLRLPAAELRTTTGLLFSSQSLSGMIWLTPYLMVCDWRVSRAGPMPFCWPSCSLLFCQLFSLSLLFLYWLVVWGWGLRTDRVSISLSRPSIANVFI